MTLYIHEYILTISFTCKVLPQNGIAVQIFLQTGLLIGQLTIVVRTAHFIFRFRNVLHLFTVVIFCTG